MSTQLLSNLLSYDPVTLEVGYFGGAHGTVPTDLQPRDHFGQSYAPVPVRGAPKHQLLWVPSCIVAVSNVDISTRDFMAPSRFDKVRLIIPGRMLLLSQNNPAENGIWMLGWRGRKGQTIVRPSDAHESICGLTVLVESGTHAGQMWCLVNCDPDLFFKVGGPDNVE